MASTTRRAAQPDRQTSERRSITERPLWTCPECGARFVTKHMWHSCGQATLAEWKGRMGPHARTLYERFEQMIAACGKYYIAPAKTRIPLLAWLGESYRLMGMQERLRTDRAVKRSRNAF